MGGVKTSLCPWMCVHADESKSSKQITNLKLNKMKYDNENFKWSTDQVKIFTRIYSSNFCKIPRCFKWQNYEGKNLDAKIEQFISDVRKVEKKRDELREIVNHLYCQAYTDARLGDRDSTKIKDDLTEQIYNLLTKI
tara:strand:- start:182 stop:592 length:411 start_codon:yes stop_codon:yes gene_type:complete